jgi:hypothetical protein
MVMSMVEEIPRQEQGELTHAVTTRLIALPCRPATLNAVFDKDQGAPADWEPLFPKAKHAPLQCRRERKRPDQ